MCRAPSVFGELFEAFVIQEIFRLNQYLERDFRLSYFRTKGGAEVDLVLSKGRRTILVEIKSSPREALVLTEEIVDSKLSLSCRIAFP